MIDFKLGQESFFPQTEWLSHPKLNGFTQQRRKREGGRKSRSVVDMNEWGYSRAAHTVVTQIGPSPKLQQHARRYYIILYEGLYLHWLLKIRDRKI